MKNSFSGFSYKEKIVSYYVGKYFFIRENYHPEWLEGKELDIYIPRLKIGIEYDGGCHQSEYYVLRDIEKNNLCSVSGVRLFRIRECNCPRLGVKDCIYLKDTTLYSLKCCIVFLLHSLGIKNPDVEISRDIKKIDEYINSIAKVQSLEEYCKSHGREDILMEWNYKKNTKSPSGIEWNSPKKVFWMCSSCKYEWQEFVCNRVSSNRQCKKCDIKLLNNNAFGSFRNWCIQTDREYLLSQMIIEKNRGVDLPLNADEWFWWKCSDGKLIRKTIKDRLLRTEKMTVDKRYAMKLTDTFAEFVFYK